MQGQPACRAGEPSGQGEEPPPEGLGGGYPLSQTDPRRPAGQVVGHRLDGQPGAVGGEAARGEMVQPDAVLEVAYGILDLGVAAGSSSNSPSRSVMKLQESPEPLLFAIAEEFDIHPVIGAANSATDGDRYDI